MMRYIRFFIKSKIWLFRWLDWRFWILPVFKNQWKNNTFTSGHPEQFVRPFIVLMFIVFIVSRITGRIKMPDIGIDDRGCRRGTHPFYAGNLGRMATWWLAVDLDIDCFGRNVFCIMPWKAAVSRKQVYLKYRNIICYTIHIFSTSLMISLLRCSGYWLISELHPKKLQIVFIQ